MTDWVPPSTLEERLRSLLIPGSLFIRYRVNKELRKGERELSLLPFLVDPSRDAVDIGANQGVWTHTLLGLCPRVFAFEPNPKIYGWLQRNIKSPRATLSPIALSNEAGEAELRVPRGKKGYSNQGASLSTVKVAENFETVKVEMKTLDALELENIGFIKIDVEGFELSVLEGARETLKRCRPTMIIEMEERHAKRPIEEMLAEVEGYGYAAYALTKNGIQPTGALDFEACHRSLPPRADYVFNFIFFPKAG